MRAASSCRSEGCFGNDYFREHVAFYIFPVRGACPRPYTQPHAHYHANHFPTRTQRSSLAPNAIVLSGRFLGAGVHLPRQQRQRDATSPCVWARWKIEQSVVVCLGFWFFEKRWILWDWNRGNSNHYRVPIEFQERRWQAWGWFRRAMHIITKTLYATPYRNCAHALHNSVGGGGGGGGSVQEAEYRDIIIISC